MDKGNDSVMEFLSSVPLLQRLPSASIIKISQLVTLQNYEAGYHVISEGSEFDGIYFILEGEAKVVGSIFLDEEDSLEYRLAKYDYFGVSSSLRPPNIVALTKLSCVVLPGQYRDLLWPKSIWSAYKTEGSFMEDILHLESIEFNLFKGVSLPDAPRFGKVFGGQFMGQALAAASKSVDCLKLVHNLHASFLSVGDLNLPIIYKVERTRNGKSFAARKVDAIQKGNVVFTLVASFHKEEEGCVHQFSEMPRVPDPESLISIEELFERRLVDPLLPRSYRIKQASISKIPWPIEIRFCEPNLKPDISKSIPSLRYWFRARGKLSDDQALHRCVAAYASDLLFLEVIMNPHRARGLNRFGPTLNHAMWFHRSFRADEWLLFVIDSPVAHGARGFVEGKIFSMKGELVMSLNQEGLMRTVISTSHGSKL